jgi:hypothetical protein
MDVKWKWKQLRVYTDLVELDEQPVGDPEGGQVVQAGVGGH